MLRKLIAKPVPKEDIAQAIGTLKSRIAASNPLAIYVFGSAAKGEALDCSDIDMAAVYETKEQARSAKRIVLSQPPTSSFPTDILFFDRETFDKKSRLGGVCYLIVNEGKRLQ